MKGRFRLLPVIIFAATFALTVRIGGFWTDTSVEVMQATAADSAEQKEDADRAKDAADHGPAPEGNPLGGASKRDSRVGDEFDPTSVTQAEFLVLQRLANRRAELDKLQNDLTLRENLLAATEKRLNAKLAELDKLKTLIQDQLKKHDAEQEKKLKSLVKIYETMKPKNAARIFERLEMEILLDVVERMREMKTAPIFAAMDPGKAKAVTAELAERRQLPSPDTVAGDS